MWKNSLTVEKFFDCGKFHDFEKFPQLSKIDMTVEKFHDSEKFTSLWNNSLAVEKCLNFKIFLDCGNFSLPWKINFLDRRKNDRSNNFQKKC